MKITSSLDTYLGDAQSFFSDLLARVKQAGFPDFNNRELSHLTYRVATQTEYEDLKEKLKSFSKLFSETQFNGRAVSIFVLKKTLELESGFTCDVIELPAPRAAHTYPSGLESLGLVIGESLLEFTQQHQDKLTGIKDHGIHCQPAFITFDNGKTFKFYNINLLEIIQRQGWQLEILPE